MIALAIAGSVALFLGLTLLLLSLNLASLWRWYIKAGAIVVTLSSVVALYLIITGVIGWASPGQMPARFSLLSTRIVEPDKLSGTPGHIYLWVEEVDDRQIVISPPRAFEIPYVVQTAGEVATAQGKVDAGGKVLGKIEASGEEEAHSEQTEKNNREKGQEAGVGTEGQSSVDNEGASMVGDASVLSFADMPPVVLPDKATMLGIGF